MTYLYDILLNFNKEFIEFFEWNETDKIFYIKKIPIFRVESSFLNDLFEYDIQIESHFFEKVKNKVEFYEEETNDSMVLFCDDTKVVGAWIKDGKITLVSRLLIDEETEALKIGSSLPLTVFCYDLLKNANRFFKDGMTRKERKVQTLLLNEFQHLYESNRIEKLNYYYYEYFDEISSDKDYVFQKLKDSLKNFNQKHQKLYEIIKLSCSFYEKNK